MEPVPFLEALVEQISSPVTLAGIVIALLDTILIFRLSGQSAIIARWMRVGLVALLIVLSPLLAISFFYVVLFWAVWWQIRLVLAYIYRRQTVSIPAILKVWFRL